MSYVNVGELEQNPNTESEWATLTADRERDVMETVQDTR